jgi:hypothetical protein
MARVRPVPLPPDCLALRHLPRFDYADAFRVELPRQPSAGELAQTFLLGPPRWVVALLRLRNLLVRPLGLAVDVPASALHPRPGLAVGDALGFMRVYEVTEPEVVLGADDRHLDYRVSLRIEGRAAVASTLVLFHNALGRAYFVPVKPFHRLVVPAMLRRAASAL